MILASDDLLESEAIESTISFMKKNPQARYSYSMHRRIDEKGNFICERRGYPFSRRRLTNYNFVGHVQCFEKDLFEKLGGYDGSFYAEDYDFTLRASEILDDSQILQNPLFLHKYRIHGNNRSIEGLEESRQSITSSIKNSLKRREGIDVDVFWSHVTQDNYNYFDWRMRWNRL